MKKIKAEASPLTSLEQTSEGSYVDVKIHPNSKLDLTTLILRATRMGRDIEPGVFPVSELHCTVMYSTSTIPAAKAKGLLNGARQYDAEVKGVDVFGPNKDTLVLIVESPELTDLHNQLLGLGGTPTFPDYKAHITIQKPVTATFKKRVEEYLKELPEPMMVKLYREYMSALATVEVETADTPK